MEIIGIILTIFNFIFLIYLIIRFKWNKYEKSIVEKLRKEVSQLIVELNRVTERNITLIENSIIDKNKFQKKQINQKHIKKKINENINIKIEKKADKEKVNHTNSFYQRASYNLYNNLSKKNKKT